MKRMWLMIAAICMTVAAVAQTLVVDENGEPMIGALILNNSSKPVGIVDKDGIMPEFAPGNFPLTIRSLGYEDTRVDTPTSRVVMKDAAYALSEVTVTPGDRPACRVVCYVRETSGMMNDRDTMLVTAQYMVDFMLKDNPKAKGFPTWDSPRVLNREIELSRSAAGRINENEIDVLSWYKFFRMSDENISFPASLHGKTSGNFTTKSKKLDNDMVIYQLTPSRFSIFSDNLADREGHSWSPGLAKLLGATMDIYEFWTKSVYNFSPQETYNFRNTIAKTFSVKVLGRGRLFRSFFNSQTPVDMTSYCEIYPVAIEYLTPQEAKELKKEKEPTYPMTVPANARLE